MEFIKRLVTYNTEYRINWIEKENISNKSGNLFINCIYYKIKAIL